MSPSAAAAFDALNEARAITDVTLRRRPAMRCGDCKGMPKLNAAGVCPKCETDFSSQRDAT